MSMESEPSPEKNYDDVLSRRASSKFIYPSNVTENLMGVHVNREKTSDDRIMIESAIIKHFLFANLIVDVRRMVIDKMELYEFDEEAVIFEQNDHATYFYVID